MTAPLLDLPHKVGDAFDHTARYDGCPVATYQRWRVLPRLVRTDDIDISEPIFSLPSTEDLAITMAILERLCLALARAIRRRDAKSWTYAGTPHEAIRQAHTAEHWILEQQRQSVRRSKLASVA